MSQALYKREMKGSVKLLVIFGAVITLYVPIIITMYDPKLMAMLDSFVAFMPGLMSAVGMTAGATTLLGFMISYLYGFILLVFPMVYSILRANGLVSRYVDRGSMVPLLAAPVKRRTVAVTQGLVLVSGIVILLIFSTALEIVCAAVAFPGELSVADVIRLNGGLLCLHLCLGGICFLSSCAFSDARYSTGVGAGVPVLMYVLQMLANMGGAGEKAKYITLFSLYDPTGLAAGDTAAVLGSAVLLALAAGLYVLAVVIFSKKDLHI